MMVYKVLTLTTLTLFTICASDSRMLMPKLSTEQELPVPRFNRHDIPMNFKYGHSHQYSTPSPMQPAQVVPNMYQRIQYAPLHGRINQKNKNAAAEYTKVTPTLSSASAGPTEPFKFTKGKSSYGKSHLEPRVPSGQVLDSMKCYSPGHNVEVFSSVSRSPGHNAVYRNFPEPIPRDKFKANFIRPYGVYPNIIPLTTTMMPFDLPETVAKPFSVPNQHYVLNPNSVDSAGPVVEKIKRQYSPYAKFHRLHLNIARVYSPGQAPPKSPAFADTYSLNFGRLPVHSQAYIPPVYQALPIQKTMLYPVKDNQKNYRFRLP